MKLQDLKNKFDIIGNSDGLNFALATAEKVASTDLTVLIMGESGVGKEIFSKIIHQLSSRKHNAFIAINCGAIPEGTIDSELFGHEKGSFTGALDKRKGYFEAVDKGTIFLDEIGEMPIGTQSRLLRLLQNGEFIKVGASNIQQADVRVIAATNINLIEAVQKSKFREDLYYRLNTVPIIVPPLRERGNDILLLFRKFCVDFSEKNNIEVPVLTDSAKQLLLNYRWPGNIRQLKNVAEQVCLLIESSSVDVEDLHKFIPNSNTSLNISQQSNTSFQYGNDLNLKMLVDIKQDLNDIKRLFFELTNKSNQQMEQYNDLHEQFENQLNRNEYSNGNFSPTKAIELTDGKGHITIEKNAQQIEDQESLSLVDMEKKYIVLALKKHKGKRKYAAEELGISERTLYRKIIDYNLEE